MVRSDGLLRLLKFSIDDIMIVLVNGPPGSGKDTVGECIRRQFGSRVDKFAKFLKEATHRLYDVRGPDGAIAPHDYFESRKDRPCDEFNGSIPRQCYIGVDRYLKDMHGIDILGKKLLDIISGYEHWRTSVVTDSGFVDEAMVLVRHYGVDNIAIIRLHRFDCCFTNDSRGYISIPGVRSFDVTNNSDLSGLAYKASVIANDIGVANEGATDTLSQAFEANNI